MVFRLVRNFNINNLFLRTSQFASGRNFQYYLDIKSSLYAGKELK